MKNLFIVFEGIDGSGTSTQAELLKEYLIAKNSPTVISPEPTDSPIGRLIREAMQKPIFHIQNQKKFDELMAYLFAADRHYHLYNDRDGVLKLINQDLINVITTRYYFSSLAYNCHTQEEFNFVLSLNQRFPQPDLVIYIDIPIKVSLLRLSERVDKEIYENEAKLIQVKQNYQNIFYDYSGLLLKIDGSGDIKSIHQEIINFFNQHFNN